MATLTPKSGKKMTVTVFAGVFLICLAAAFLYRDDIFSSYQDPGQPFQTYAPPTAPDYSTEYAWLALPDLTADTYFDKTQGDAFVVVPSVYRGGDHWNLPMDDEVRRSKIERIARPNYVAPYGSAGRLFAPYYRQASLYTFMTNREDARRARDLAYSDVKRAFEVFLTNNPPERPIILAGHGQGAEHVQRLLADYFQGELKNRLAAAYVIDHPLPLDMFESDLKALSPCEAETDTKCVIAYGIFLPRDNFIANRYVSRALVHSKNGYAPTEGRPLLCMNPLLWDRSTDYAPRRLHLGGLAAEGLDPDMNPAPLAKQTGAQCEDGILMVDKPKSKALRRPIVFGGKFRTIPSNLFYEDLRQNAVKRVEAMRNSGELPTRAKKLDDLDVIEIIESPIVPIDGPKK